MGRVIVGAKIENLCDLALVEHQLLESEQARCLEFEIAPIDGAMRSA